MSLFVSLASLPDSGLVCRGALVEWEGINNMPFARNHISLSKLLDTKTSMAGLSVALQPCAAASEAGFFS